MANDITMQRNHSIDIIKGFGILCVVLGHILLGTIHENVVRYVIYSFHMPLFFFISGYLINIDKLADMHPKLFVKKYFKRMLCYWCIAWVVFNAIIYYDYLSFRKIVWSIIIPWFHLWFVPGLFACFALTYILRRYVRMCSGQVIVSIIAIGLLQMIVSESKTVTNLFYIRHYNMLFYAIGLGCNFFNLSKLEIKKGGGSHAILFGSYNVNFLLRRGNK